jgi:hypothetical protein
MSPQSKAQKTTKKSIINLDLLVVEMLTIAVSEATKGDKTHAKHNSHPPTKAAQEGIPKINRIHYMSFVFLVVRSTP